MPQANHLNTQKKTNTLRKLLGPRKILRVLDGGGKFWQTDLKYALDKHVLTPLNLAEVMIIYVSKHHLLLP